MNSISKFIQKNFYYICLILIFLFAFFLRAYRITEIPDTVHTDEAFLGRNAWLLANYSIDESFNHNPIYPQNGINGQSPLYTYLVVLLIKTIGKGSLSLGLLRFPGLLFSMLTVIFGALMIKQVFQNRKVTLIGALLLTVCPYFIMHGRGALDCHLMLGCCTVSLYFLIKYVNTNRLRELILYSISFGLVMYSYALAYLVVPVFLCIVSLYLLYMKKITIKRILLSALCVCLTSLPILLFIFTLLFDLKPFQFLCFQITPVSQGRLNEINSSDFIPRIINILKITLTYGSIRHETLPKFYTMYPVSIPFIILGMLQSFYLSILGLIKKNFHFESIFLLFFLSCLITAGSVSMSYTSCTWHANYFFIAYLFFLVSGLLMVCRFLYRYKKIYIITMLCCYFMWAGSFIHYYFSVFSLSNVYPNSLTFAYEPVAVEYVESHWTPEQLYLDYFGDSLFYTFSFPVSPYELDRRENPAHWNNYYFKIDDSTPILPGAAYVVHKQNLNFINKVNTLHCDYDFVEFKYYNVYYFDADTIIE